MLGAILVSIGTFFDEISDSIGKYEVRKKKESPQAMVFLSIFWAAILFALICLFKQDSFIFDPKSLPTFITRAFLEIIQLYVTVLAIIKADRSTFGFIRTLTIPLLLLVDIILGYSISYFSIAGMVVIIFAILVLFMNSGIKKKGAGLVLFTALNAVATLSLFKYDISHYNSVAAEQLILNLILLVFAFFFVLIQTNKNPLKLLGNPIFFLQSAAMGLGGVIVSFGYNYGTASVMTAVKRASSIFWSILSGKAYFKEKHFLLKSALFLLLLLGLVLLIFG